MKRRIVSGMCAALFDSDLIATRLTLAQRQQAAAIRVHLADVSASTFVDLGRDDTRAGVQALETGGLIGVGRALQILDAPVEAHERPAP